MCRSGRGVLAADENKRTGRGTRIMKREPDVTKSYCDYFERSNTANLDDKTKVTPLHTTK